MSNFVKFSVEDRVYNKGRRAKYVYTGSGLKVSEVIERDLKELKLPNDERFYNAWVEGFDSETEHNPGPKPFEFEAPVLRQKIKFDGVVRGLVIAFIRNGHVFVGWSIRRKDDPIKYDPEWAFVTARVTARPLHKFWIEDLPKFTNTKKVFTRWDKNGLPVYETFQENVAHTIYSVIGRAFHYYQQLESVI